MTTTIKTTRRSAVGLKALGASSYANVNIRSRGTLDQTILQISTRTPGGGSWVFHGNSVVSGGTPLQSGTIQAAGMNGTYVVLRTGSGTFLQVSLGNRTYGYKAVAHTYFPRGSAQNIRRMQGMPHGLPNALGSIGATNPSFQAPTSTDVANNPPGQALADAAVALLAYFSSNGVPSEHGGAGGNVSAFQSAWNADPLSSVTSNGKLSVDDAYGPNTHDALASISGGSAPTVNTAPAPQGGSSTSTTTTTTTSTTNNLFAGMPVWAKWLVGAAAVGGAYVVGTAVVKKHGGKVTSHARRLHGRLQHHARRLTRRPA